eukprot:tig00021319_g20261.t1
MAAAQPGEIDLKQIFQAAASSSPDAQRQSARALLQLSSMNDATRVKILKEGGLPTLVALAGSADVEVQRSTAACFAQLATNAENQAILVKDGGLKAMLALLATTDVQVQRAGLAALMMLAQKPEHNAEIVNHGGLSRIIAIAKSDNPDLQLGSASTLSVLSANSKASQVKIVEEGGLPVLCTLARSSNLEVKKQAARAITACVSNDQNKAAALASDMPTLAIFLASSEDPQVRHCGAVNIANLAAYEECKTKLVENGGLAALINFAKSDDAEAQLCAALALARVSTNPENQGKIVDGGGLSPLITLGANGNRDIRYLAAVALANLTASGAPDQAKIIKEGGLKVLIALIGSGEPQALGPAAAALANLASSEENHAVIVDENGIEALINLVKSRVPETHAHACRALSLLAAHDKNKPKIIEKGGLLPLSQLVLNTKSAEIQRYVASILGQCANDDANNVKMCRQEVLQALKALASVADDEVKLCATWAIANLAQKPQNKEMVVQHVGLDLLKELNRCGNVMVQCEAGRALQNLQGAEATQAPMDPISIPNLGPWTVDFNELVLEKRVGVGGFGEVFRGTYKGEEVAIKKLLSQHMTKEDMLDFRNEVEMQSKLSHINVVRFVGACLTPPNLCIVTEFVSKGSLRTVLQQMGKSIEWKNLIKMAADIAQGMAYLHSQNPAVVHRDLKSENLLATEDLTIKIADFGLARVKSHSTTMTQCGTPKYMAPEVLKGERYNEKADIYSYGIVLWELITHKEPYGDMHPMTAAMKIAYQGLRPKIPSNCDPAYRDLIKDCWATNPAARPTFDEIVKRLAKFKT